MLCIEGANAAINKYFVDDIHDLIDVRLLSLNIIDFSVLSVYSPFSDEIGLSVDLI